MSVGSNLPLSETSPTMTSVWTGGGEKFHLGPVKGTLCFHHSSEACFLKFEFSSCVYGSKQGPARLSPTPAVTFQLEHFPSFVHINHIVHLKRRHVFDWPPLIYHQILAHRAKSIEGTREKEYFLLMGQKKRNLSTSLSGIGCAGD